MSKIYDILLDNINIGTTELEHADVPMGVVFGRINFISIQSVYGFSPEYCLKKALNFITMQKQGRSKPDQLRDYVF